MTASSHGHYLVCCCCCCCCVFTEGKQGCNNGVECTNREKVNPWAPLPQDLLDINGIVVWVKAVIYLLSQKQRFYCICQEQETVMFAYTFLHFMIRLVIIIQIKLSQTQTHMHHERKQFSYRAMLITTFITRWVVFSDFRHPQSSITWFQTIYCPLCLYYQDSPEPDIKTCLQGRQRRRAGRELS